MKQPEWQPLLLADGTVVEVTAEPLRADDGVAYSSTPVEAQQAIDPTTPKLTLVPPRGRKLVLASELVHGATGVYSYELTPSTLGSWTGEWSGTVNGKPVASLPFKFTVRARL